MIDVAPAGVVADLVFHGLACVPLAGPERLFDPTYVAWARASMPADAIEPLAGDGPAIGADLDARGAGLVAQHLPWLTRDLGAFVAAAKGEVSAIDPASRVLGAGHVGVDWLHADLALAAGAFASARDAWRPEIEATCDRLRELHAATPHLAWPARIEVAWALGSHGRVAPDGTVVVGACASWNQLPPSVPAVLALHEAAVVAAGGGYDRGEWEALGSVARALASGPAYLRVAHGRWLASLDLEALIVAAEREGRASTDVARRLRDTPDLRRELFAALS